MVPAFMLSLLKRQQLMLAERFIARYPSCWLVWAPGSWKPPHTTAESDAGKTQLPDEAHDLRPRGSDALCFQLYLTRGAEEGQFTLGRGSDRDIVVNDMTVSRDHLRLHFTKGVWSAEAVAAPGASTRLGSRALAAGEKQPLAPGSPVTVGGVTLTFYDPDGFLKRLTA